MSSERNMDVVDALITVPAETVKSYVNVLYGSLQGSFFKAIQHDVCSVERLTPKMSEPTQIQKPSYKSRQRVRTADYTVLGKNHPSQSRAPKDFFENLSMDEIGKEESGILNDVGVLDGVPNRHKDRMENKCNPPSKASSVRSWKFSESQRSAPELRSVPILRTTSDQSAPSKTAGAHESHQSQAFIPFPGTDPRASRTLMHDAGSAFSRTFSDASARSAQSRPRSESRPRHARSVTFSQSAGDLNSVRSKAQYTALNTREVMQQDRSRLAIAMRLVRVRSGEEDRPP
jgi:hypothetical protein